MFNDIPSNALFARQDNVIHHALQAAKPELVNREPGETTVSSKAITVTQAADISRNHVNVTV